MTTAPKHPALPAPDGSSDPWLWLEEVTGEKALEWVREQSDAAETEIDASGLTAELTERFAEILDSDDKIPGVVKRGDYLYNFWTDAQHVRGLWRRTTWDSFLTEQPEWEILLDVDALNKAEAAEFVWHGAHLLREADGSYRRALISLSPGGSDADETREFDLDTKSFIAPSEGGFFRAESKGSLAWLDADTVLISTDFGPETMTESGYPRQVRKWRRGEELANTTPLINAEKTDMSVFMYHDQTPGYERTVISLWHSFYSTKTYLLDEADHLNHVAVPDDVSVGVFRDYLVFDPRSDWQAANVMVPAGAIAVAPIAEYMAGNHQVEILFNPDASSSLSGFTVTKNLLVLNVLKDVRNHLEYRYLDKSGNWVAGTLYEDLPGSVQVSAVDGTANDQLWIYATGFLTPTTLLLGDIAEVARGGQPAPLQTVKSEPARFNTEGLQVTQHFATSKDGTKVPYFQVGPINPPEAADNSTLLYGYGGFEVSLEEGYQAILGAGWLERGGTYVLANIRGGGEYGPAWHQAALKEKRHKAYEDFAAVAEDLFTRGVTVKERLACRGGSNGGLLTGNMLAQYSHLFGAIIVQVPLLDMFRYHKLLAGASWMAEYGNPETSDWDFIQTFSPYHLLDPDTDYPPTLVMTSTRDDRVHPGHARKLVAALKGMDKNIRFWENTQGGHAGAADNAQVARMNALTYAFLWEQIGK